MALRNQTCCAVEHLPESCPLCCFSKPKSRDLCRQPRYNMFSRLTGRKTQESTPASPAAQPSNSRAGTHQPGVPLELVRYDTDTGKFHAGEEALKTLRATSQPIGVVAVCGRARQGKSFILNQLLGQSTGFQVAPTVRPCTKGLWMWSAPIKRKAADGSQHQLVLITCCACCAATVQTCCRNCELFCNVTQAVHLFRYCWTQRASMLGIR